MERESDDLPVLIGQAGPLNGSRWLINNPLVIGRDATCQIIVPDRQVSRYHARIMSVPEGVILEDLGSKNGTYCNGTKIEDPIVLQDGDLVQIALVQHFVFLSSDATVPLEGGEGAISEPKGKLVLDNRSHRVWLGKQEIVPPLSVPQFKLLQLLYERQNQVIPRQELVTVIWGDEVSEGVSEQALDALIRRLRDRLLFIDPNHNYIVTVRGHGLRLDNPFI